jgi:hypothetical protein
MIILQCPHCAAQVRIDGEAFVCSEHDTPLVMKLPSVEQVTEIERLRNIVRQLRTAWFEHHLQFHALEREWEDERDLSRRMRQNDDNLILFSNQTERILQGEKLTLIPYCLADMDESR